MNTFFEKKDAARMGKALLFLALMLALFVTMLFVDQIRKVSAPGNVADAATIQVTGTGNTFAEYTDIATESFTVEQEAPTVSAAQATVTQNVNGAVAFLKSSGVADSDIQTTDYSANPNYSYPVPCTAQPCTSAITAPTVTGYTVSETITVKIRDTGSIGAIVDGLGKEGVTGLSGPNFTVDDMETVNAAARAAAIADAKAKAATLAKELGVRLVRITGFSEDTGATPPSPMLYAAAGAAMNASAAPAVSPGQNEYTSNVTITYEIR